MLQTIFLSIAAFAGTNLDDIWINTLLFSQTHTRGQQAGVVLGKYLATAVLLLLSLLCARALDGLPRGILACLGLVPLALGIRELWQLRSAREDTVRPVPAVGLLSTVFLTLANGGDNLGVYIPFFSGLNFRQKLGACMVFLVLTGLWCVLGKTLSRLPGLRGFLARHGAVLVPVVYLGLGVYIVVRNLV